MSYYIAFTISFPIPVQHLSLNELFNITSSFATAPHGVEGQRGALHADSLEVPAGLQVV